MRITLLVADGPCRGRTFTFDEHDTFVVGRSRRAHFRLSGDRFTTNAFVNLTCEKTVGLYEWDLREDRLTLIALQDPCDVRVALFGTTPWQRAR